MNLINVALVVAGALAIIGVSLAVIAPLTSGSPHAETLPPGVAITADPSVAASGSTGPSTQPSTNPTSRPPTASASPTGRFRPDDLESQAVKLTNDARKQANCGNVKTNSKLHTLARGHSTDMAANNQLTSTGSDGASYAERAARAGIKDPLGENIAHGPVTADAVVQAWLANSTSRKKMLDCNAQSIGVGVARAADGSYYWTQDFSK